MKERKKRRDQKKRKSKTKKNEKNAENKKRDKTQVYFPHSDNREKRIEKKQR